LRESIYKLLWCQAVDNLDVWVFDGDPLSAGCLDYQFTLGQIEFCECPQDVIDILALIQNMLPM
jgi:hypothetical protein